MKKIFLLIAVTLFSLPTFAQYDADTENGVVSFAGRKGFIWESKNGKFEFKPYLMVQTGLDINYYDSEGLDPAYNQDNVHNTGFSIPYAVLGFTGRAFGFITYNLSINAAASGGGLLQQAWADMKIRDEFGVKVGKFKTPFTHATLTTLGETLFPTLPVSLTAPVIMPYSLNAVTPSMATGFDLGVELHGMVKNKFGYQVGIFNGTGSSVNLASKTFSDDWHIPSLLYAARLTYQPNGVMPATQGNPNQLNLNKLLVGVSASMNVESENESTNDLRVGLEVAWMKDRLYLAGEAYYMHVGFTKRQKIDDSFNYLGGYVQAGYFVTDRLQPALRYDFMDRNGLDKGGFLNMPAVGLNYYFKGVNLKLQAMYRYIGRTGHKTQLDRDNDDLGLAQHNGTIQIQYTF
ncbi:MAG: OprO/OprP family phosphate-selective porin [Prevotella sp.]|nr:OprO/OprP family phosphate-selective porin [Bacteroides sp.]MCM1367129.1 OprO/OprP family phosphate-selective porin [Prevotella sp.]MCM1437437.1 OprO/OprP family phosphate-selective porin [Prevotella sp.]